jgi:hypothetical protein
MIARANLRSEDRNSESCATVDPRIAGEDAGKSAAFASLTLVAAVPSPRSERPSLLRDKNVQRSTHNAQRQIDSVLKIEC